MIQLLLSYLPRIALVLVFTTLFVLFFPIVLRSQGGVLDSPLWSALLLLFSAPALAIWMFFEYRLPLSENLSALVGAALSIAVGIGLTGLVLSLGRRIHSIRRSAKLNSGQVATEYRASLNHVRLLLLVFFAILIAAAVFALQDHKVTAGGGYISVSALCSALYSYCSDVHFTTKMAWRSHVWGTYCIRWDDVSDVRLSSARNWLVFHGQGRRLPVIGTAWWRSAGRHDLITFIDDQLKARGLEVMVEPRIGWPVATNCRCPRQS